MKIIYSALVSLLLVGCQAQEQEQTQSGKQEESAARTEQAPQLDAFANVNVDMAQQLIATGDVIILDVRTPREYQAGHIEGAQLMDFYGQDFSEELAGLPKDKKYLVYCASGNRSGQAVTMMKSLNFQEAHNMMGGIGAWRSKSYKTVQ